MEAREGKALLYSGGLREGQGSITSRSIPTHTYHTATTSLSKEVTRIIEEVQPSPLPDSKLWPTDIMVVKYATQAHRTVTPLHRQNTTPCCELGGYQHSLIDEGQATLDDEDHKAIEPAISIRAEGTLVTVEPISNRDGKATIDRGGDVIGPIITSSGPSLSSNTKDREKEDHKRPCDIMGSDVTPSFLNLQRGPSLADRQPIAREDIDQCPDIVHETIVESEDIRLDLFPSCSPCPLNTHLTSEVLPTKTNGLQVEVDPTSLSPHLPHPDISRVERKGMLTSGRIRTSSEADAAWVLTHLDSSKGFNDYYEGRGVGLLAEATREEHAKLQQQDARQCSILNMAPEHRYTSIGSGQVKEEGRHVGMKEEDGLLLDLLKYKREHQECVVPYPSREGLQGQFSLNATPRSYPCDSDEFITGYLGTGSLNTQNIPPTNKEGNKPGISPAVASQQSNQSTPVLIPQQTNTPMCTTTTSPPATSLCTTGFSPHDSDDSDNETEPESWSNEKEDDSFVPSQPQRINPKYKVNTYVTTNRIPPDTNPIHPTISSVVGPEPGLSAYLYNSRPPAVRAAAAAAATAIAAGRESQSASDDEMHIDIGLDEPTGLKLKLPMRGKKRKGRRGYGCRCPYAGCIATFQYPSSLERHVRVHTGDRPYMCGIEGCMKSFTQETHMRKHKRNVHGGR